VKRKICGVVSRYEKRTSDLCLTVLLIAYSVLRIAGRTKVEGEPWHEVETEILCLVTDDGRGRN
jgi:hypothetical protein